MKALHVVMIATVGAMLVSCDRHAALEGQAQIEQRSKALVPSPPWPAGDERGMANAIGRGTWTRCAYYLGHESAKVYELSHVRSSTMPISPFAGPFVPVSKPTIGIAGSAHAMNMNSLNEGADPGQQGTQIDAIGHFGFFDHPWDGKEPLPEQATYYAGFTQKDVKPTSDSPLVRLGIDKAPPLITTAVLLDGKQYLGGGEPMKAGQMVTAKDIESMLQAQGLSERGILPGDVVYVHTGWGDYWKDPDTEKFYYTMAPGLSYDAARYLGERRIVAISLDAPFIEPVAEGQLAGKVGPPEGAPAGLPFAVHHLMLTQMGIHHMENAKLDELAHDKVWTSCTIILPLLEKGAAGSPVRPVAIGLPNP